MDIFDKNLAQEKLNDIAKKHLLKPDILKDVVWGRSQGWSQARIAHECSHNPNTICKYSRILEREISAKEIKELLILIGLLLGATYILKNLFKGGE